jgi:MFS family permease
VTVMGAAIAIGTLTGGRGGGTARLRRRYLLGLGTVAAGLLACALAPSFLVAVPAFALLGLGNGGALAHERLLLQSTLDDEVLGRVFGLRSSLVALAFASAFLTAGSAAALLGPHPLFLLAAGGAFVVWVLASAALRGGRSVAGPPRVEPAAA